MIPVVISAGRSGSLPLLRTVDSASRQTLPTSISLAISSDPASAVVASLVSRVGAQMTTAESDAAAISVAVQRAAADFVVVVRVPWRLDANFVERLACILGSQPEVGVVVPALRLQSQEGALLRTVDSALTIPALLASPLETPPVFAIRRRVWEIVGEMDARFGSLAASEWWLRLLSGSVQIARIDDPLGYLMAGPQAWWPSIGNDRFDVVQFREMLEKHRGVLERDVQSLVVEQEVAFAQLTSTHRDALRRRDEHLAELDRLRAQAAHHRAYLEHHGHGALDWGDLKRADPVSRNWGYDRGTPIDRHYIEEFLASCSSDIAGTSSKFRSAISRNALAARV